MSPEPNTPDSIANTLCLRLATLLGVGYIPKFPGTAASLVSLPLAYIIAGGGWIVYLTATLLITAIAIPICDRAAKVLGDADPSCVVFDELAGILISYAPFSFFPPGGHFFPALLLAFFWFRVFDIWKPGLIGKVQSIKGGAGIVLDDVLAGILAACASHLSFWLMTVAVSRTP